MKMKLAKWGLISIPTDCAIVLAVLKMCGLTEMSWWWVTAPVWVCIALPILLFAVIYLRFIVWKLRHPAEYRRKTAHLDRD